MKIIDDVWPGLQAWWERGYERLVECKGFGLHDSVIMPCVTGQGAWANGKKPETGPNGMPIRRELNADERKGNFEMKKSEEKRPGLATETIDRKAYDEFMRGL